MKLDRELQLSLLMRIYDLQKAIGDLSEQINFICRSVETIDIPDVAKGVKE